MVMVNYSLEGTAYGGTYDDFIGALWVTPNRIQDQKLNCLAHELGHSFQLQIMADKTGEAWGGSGFFEMTSQWMPSDSLPIRVICIWTTSIIRHT